MGARQGVSVFAGLNLPFDVLHRSRFRRLASLTPAAEAYRVDEVNDIRDKAVAIQSYARQAEDG